MDEKFTSKIKVAGRAIEYWGSQSISSDESAIFELIKNSRDADALRVEIIFEDVTSEDGTITVKDDGNGMTREEVDGKWLIAGTDSKIRNTMSSGGRRVWGEMGIGRFACERLAKKTTMVSLPRDSGNKIIMNFDWEKYKKNDITFDSVTHEGYIEAKENGSDHGVVLILENVKSKWSQHKIQKLKKELGSYILPKELRGQEDFEIKISAPEYELKDATVESGVIRIAPLQLTTHFDGKELEIAIRDKANHTNIERSSLHYAGKTCGSFKFKLYFYPLDRSGEKQWETYYEKHLENADMNDFLKKHSGIYLYRDGVWMKPYGKSNDWLGLEGRRVQRISRVGRNQIYGIVSISQDKNPGIRPTAHREVLQSTQEFEDLKSILLDAIGDLENYRNENKIDAPKPTIPPAVMAGNNISQIIKHCKSVATPQRSDMDMIRQYAAATQKFIGESIVEKSVEKEAAKEIRAHELNVMSVGLITSYVSHEVAGSLQSTEKIIADLRKAMDNAVPSKLLDRTTIGQELEWLETLEKNTGKLVHFLSFIDELSSHITISKARHGRGSQVKFRSMWDLVTNGFKPLAESTNFEYSEDPDDLRIRIDRIDLESILTNLLTNSLESMKGIETKKHTVRCAVSYVKSGLVIKFSDSGKGILLENRDKIFEPFFTTNHTRDNMVYGHGLGLTIVREILKKYQGTIEVSSEYLQSGATFQIKISSKQVSQVG